LSGKGGRRGERVGRTREELNDEESKDGGSQDEGRLTSDAGTEGGSQGGREIENPRRSHEISSAHLSCVDAFDRRSSGCFLFVTCCIMLLFGFFVKVCIHACYVTQPDV